MRVAGMAAVCAAVGGALFAVAVLATQGVMYAGYVSEAGVAGQPHWIAYRLGIFGLSAALVLLAAATRSLLPAAALALLVSGVLAGVSGSVSCSEGCPLPPFQTPTIRDLIHAGTSVMGVALCALAILLFASARSGGGLRLVSRIAVAPAILVGLVNAYGIVFVGRGQLTGLAERVMLVLVVAWCLAAGLALTGRVGGARGADSRPPSP